MNRACAAGRQAFALGALLACLLALSPSAYALNPALDISQYAHTSWTLRDGFSRGRITVVAQTPDGYLWLGSELGLLRFDGVRSVPWQPPRGASLPHSWIRTLYVARDGTLWIGTLAGLASWKDGQLRQYQEIGGSVDALLEDRRGTVWVGNTNPASPSAGRLCAIRQASVQCYDEGGRLGWVNSLYEDSDGALWVAAAPGLWQWTPGPPKVYRLSDPIAPNLQPLTKGDNRTLLVATRRGITQFPNGRVVSVPLPPSASTGPKLLRDRDGGLWIGTYSGLWHLHRGRADVFARPDGLSSNDVSRLFEDREGNIWVVTTDGLDRFREFAATTFSVSQGVAHGVSAVLASRDGSMWLNTNGVLNQWNNGTTREITRPPDIVESLLQDDRGRVWLSTSRGIGYLADDRFISIRGAGGWRVPSIVEDTRRNLWVLDQTLGLVRVSPDNDVQQISLARMGHTDFATHGAADPIRGGLWLGFHLGGVAYYADGHIGASITSTDGLGKGMVNHLRLDRDGVLWVATEGGLSRLKNTRVATLTSRNGLPCDGVHWTTEDDINSIWLRTDCGLVRIARSALDAWGAAVDNDRVAPRTIQSTVFDSSDGIRSGARVSSYSPQVDKSADGSLWFADYDGVGVIDPSHIPVNRLPPPVQIEQITADRQTYDATSGARVSLPALIRDLQINYTALSLVAPEKNGFKVKLEGWDRDWQDVGNRRQAFYNNLPPRNYRFRVIASNNSGVWNEAGASLDFAIAPAYYQTTWFQALIAMTGLALLWAAYQYRLRRIAYEFDLRLDERVSERTRVARELHDTLLQSLHGLLFRFQAVANMLPERPADAKQKLEGAIDQAAQAITEGRDAVQNLRTSTVLTNDLAVAITTLGDELAASGVNGNGTVVDVAVQGTPRDLHPILRDDIYRIAGEALRNAFRHAHAHRIEVEITYDERRFRLQVRDDGKGMDTAVLADERHGHFGLPGMRERAELIGGRLEVWSEVGAGTEVDLTIPAEKAYAAARARRRAWWFAKKTGAA